MPDEQAMYRRHDTVTVDLSGFPAEPKSIPANQEPDTYMQDLQDSEFYD